MTGFLGSGKTTLLARVLSDPSMRNTAVIVNEFGEVGLDHHLLRRAGEKTVLLGSGCVCCSRREDLVETLLELLDLEERGEIPNLDRIVVETTGLADPAPILHTVFTDPVLRHHFVVDLVLVTVDAVNGETQFVHAPESEKQVAAADKIVLTKTDIADPEAARTIAARLQALNPSASILEAALREVDPAELFRPQRAWTPERVGENEPGAPGAGTFSVSLTFDGPVDWVGFGIWLSMLLHARGEKILRVKGLLDVGEPGPVVLNGVQHTIHPPDHLAAWPDDNHRSRIIFIARSIPPENILASLDAFRDILGARPQRLTADALV